MRDTLNKLFFVLVFSSEASAWTRAAGGNVGLKVAGNASAISSGNSDPGLFALNAFVMLVTAIVCFPKLKVILNMVMQEQALVSIYVFSFLSILWSASPGNSFRTSVYLIAGLVQFTYLGFYLDTDEQVSMVANVVTFLGLLSFVGQFTLRPSGDPAPGWTGLFPSKNYLGNVMAIGLLAILLQRVPWNFARVAKTTICGVLLVLSQSFTSVLCIGICATIYLYLRLPRRSRLLLIGVGGSLFLLIAVVFPDFVSILLGASGKNTTFTGRDVIWAFAIKFISYRPILGYGYYGFWISEADSALQYLGWNPNQAHNGYLDLMLNEGVVGLGLLLLTFFVGWKRSLRQLKQGDPTGAGRWQLLMLVYLLVHNISEADFYQRPAWVVYLIAYTASAKTDLPPAPACEEEFEEADGDAVPNSLQPLSV